MQDRTVNTELDRVLSGPLAPSLTSSNNSQAALAMTGAVTAADGTAGASQGAMADALTQNTTQLAQVQSALQGQLESLISNTQALTENTSTKSSSGSTGSSIAGGVASSLLSGGGILAPIVSGLMSLFGGGSDDTSTALTKYAMPSKLEYDAGGQGSTIGGVDYNQDGQPRMVSQAASSATPQITVNVSAMDSQSFLDRSTDIANAVRKAMLESSSLNDVIGEL